VTDRCAKISLALLNHESALGHWAVTSVQSAQGKQSVPALLGCGLEKGDGRVFCALRSQRALAGKGELSSSP
jgi:hypothetical protein